MPGGIRGHYRPSKIVLPPQHGQLLPQGVQFPRLNLDVCFDALLLLDLLHVCADSLLEVISDLYKICDGQDGGELLRKLVVVSIDQLVHIPAQSGLLVDCRKLWRFLFAEPLMRQYKTFEVEIVVYLEGHLFEQTFDEAVALNARDALKRDCHVDLLAGIELLDDLHRVTEQHEGAQVLAEHLLE